MELGATVCRPKNPGCDICPVSSLCEAHTLSIQDEIPVRSPRKAVPHVDVTAGIIRKGGKILITLRPPHGLLGGLWEFPGGKKEDGESLEECLRREIQEELGIDIRVGSHFISVKHAYSHFRITLHVFECTVERGTVLCRGCTDYRWVRAEDLDAYAFPAADCRVIKRLSNKD
jgi:A/G-specific adenine glycosylase